MHVRVPGGLALLLLLGTVPAVRAQAPIGDRRPAVLVAGPCSWEMASRLHSAGFAVMTAPDPDAEPLAWERVRRCNAIVLMGLGRANADMTLTQRNVDSIETLRRFLDAGGGVLVLPVFGQMATAKPPQDAFLVPLGLTPLFQEMVLDDATRATATPWKIDFARTGEIAPSPITEGVHSLWYPVPRSRVGGQNHTIPFAADAMWTVVVKGSATSSTRTGPLQADPPTEPGRYSGSVPLAAITQEGRGRLVYLGITPEYLFGANAMTTLEGVVAERGIRDVPSDGARLVLNALEWLSEPSLAGHELGGAETDPALLADPHKTRFTAPYAWPPQTTFPPIEPALPGVVGPRTVYSGGKAAADEWALQAKARGLSWIVFLEEFAQLGEADFGRLKADCARLSSRDFAAIPGLAIDDEIGNHYFYFGSAFPYPPRHFLTPDGKRLASRDPGIDAKNPLVKGQLAMTTLDYAYSLSSFRLTAGNYGFRASAAPFANWFSNWDAMGVVSAAGGRVVEDATREYLQNVDFGNGPMPLVIDRMDDPAVLGRSGWRTVLRLPAQGGPVIAERLRADTRVQDYFDAWNFYPDNPAKLYITQGPEIESWCYAGPRDYEGSLQGDFVWQNYRWVLRGRVTSRVGLREVRVVDGEALFRRYLPGGRKAFEFSLDLAHDRQHNLVVIATDLQGRRAVGGEQWDRSHRLEEFMCSDRNNQLSYGYQTTKEGNGLLIGGNQTLATPNKRVAPGVSPAGTFKNDALLGAPAFDGAAGGEPEVWEVVGLRQPGGTQPAPDVTEARRLFHTADVHVGEGLRERYFTDNVGVYNVWHTLWRTEPARDYSVRRRSHFFQIDPDNPLAVFLWSIDVRLLRDRPNDGFDVATMGAAETSLWTVRGSDGKAETGAWGQGPSRGLRVPFGRGAYAAYLDSPLGGAAIFSLTDGMEAGVGPPGPGPLLIGLPASAAPQRAGQSKTVDLLLVGVPRRAGSAASLPPGAQVVERFYRDFGLDGGKTGYTVETRAGKVSGQRYILDVQGANGGFDARLSGRLVSSLPIRVAGLNDRWSCVLLDRGKGRARPVGVFEGKGWATVPLAGTLDLFLGHPIVADSPSVFVQATQVGERSWRVEVHNPTDRPLRVTLRAHPRFDPLRGRLPKPWVVAVPAGASAWRVL